MILTKHRILFGLYDLNDSISRVKLSEKTGVVPNNIPPHLTSLQKEGFVEKVAHGLYKITDKGKQEAEDLKIKYGGSTYNGNQTRPISIEKPSPKSSKITPEQYEELIELSSEVKEKIRSKYGDEKYTDLVRVLIRLLN